MKEDAASILRVLNFTRLLASPRGFVEFESWRQLTGSHPPPRCSEQSQQPNGRSSRGCGWRQPISLNRRVNDTRSRGYWRLLISPSGRRRCAFDTVEDFKLQTFNIVDFERTYIRQLPRDDEQNSFLNDRSNSSSVLPHFSHSSNRQP